MIDNYIRILKKNELFEGICSLDLKTIRRPFLCLQAYIGKTEER